MASSGDCHASDSFDTYSESSFAFETDTYEFFIYGGLASPSMLALLLSGGLLEYALCFSFLYPLLCFNRTSTLEVGMGSRKSQSDLTSPLEGG